MSPQRIQLRRTKGWRKPEGSIVVARPSKWGNPCTLAFAMDTGEAVDAEDARQLAVDWFDAWLTEPIRSEVTDVFLDRRAWILDHIGELAGRDLACWCPADQPCHADVLLELANASVPPGDDRDRPRPREVQGEEPEAEQRHVDRGQLHAERGQKEHDRGDEGEDGHGGHVPPQVSFSTAGEEAR